MTEPTKNEERLANLARLMDEELCPACEAHPDLRAGVHDKLGPWTCALCLGRGTVPEEA